MRTEIFKTREGRGGLAGPLTVAGAASLLAAAAFVQEETHRAERQNPPIGKFIMVDGVWLHFHDTGGTGPVVALFHGNGAMMADLTISGLIDRAAQYQAIPKSFDAKDLFDPGGITS